MAVGFGQYIRHTVKVRPKLNRRKAIQAGRLDVVERFEHRPARSRWFYRIDPPVRTEKFNDPVRLGTLLELRCRTKDNSIGFQTVVPPSLHESREQVRFEPGFDGHPANVDAAHLQMSVNVSARIALIRNRRLAGSAIFAHDARAEEGDIRIQLWCFAADANKLTPMT